MSTQLDFFPPRLRDHIVRAVDDARKAPRNSRGQRLAPPQPARPSVRGQVQLELFTADGDIAEAMAAVEPYLPGADGIGHDEQ
jgi:hypothetical protein